jgi:hypothetical protein
MYPVPVIRCLVGAPAEGTISGDSIHQCSDIVMSRRPVLVLLTLWTGPLSKVLTTLLARTFAALHLLSLDHFPVSWHRGLVAITTAAHSIQLALMCCPASIDVHYFIPQPYLGLPPILCCDNGDCYTTAAPAGHTVLLPQVPTTHPTLVQWHMLSHRHCYLNGNNI